jgi:hypothetical protein
MVEKKAGGKIVPRCVNETCSQGGASPARGTRRKDKDVDKEKDKVKKKAQKKGKDKPGTGVPRNEAQVLKEI